jgi:lipid-binding SYLF domain-containing protein
MKLYTRSVLLACVLALTPGLLLAQAREDARLVLATQVLEDIMRMPDQNVPQWLLQRAHGVAVFPDVLKIGLGIGGRRGKGVLVTRREDGSWSNPVFVTVTGGSFGWQAGVQQADVVLVFTTAAGIDGITDGKLTLGADASVAAGPVGRSTSAATDANLSAEVYSYSRSRGLFAGLAVDAAAITIDRKANAAFYAKRDVTATEILSPAAPVPPPTARRFITVIASSTNGTAASPASSESTAPEQQPAAPATAPVVEGLQTYPMEDPSPGQEPPG